MQIAKSDMRKWIKKIKRIIKIMVPALESMLTNYSELIIYAKDIADFFMFDFDFSVVYSGRSYADSLNITNHFPEDRIIILSFFCAESSKVCVYANSDEYYFYFGERLESVKQYIYDMLLAARDGEIDYYKYMRNDEAVPKRAIKIKHKIELNVTFTQNILRISQHADIIKLWPVSIHRFYYVIVNEHVIIYIADDVNFYCAIKLNSQASFIKILTEDIEDIKMFYNYAVLDVFDVAGKDC
jgi:hypothetical protein